MFKGLWIRHRDKTDMSTAAESKVDRNNNKYNKREVE